MVTEQQIKLARDKFKEISGITIYTPDEGSLDDFEQSRYDGLVAALEAALSAAEPLENDEMIATAKQWYDWSREWSGSAFLNDEPTGEMTEAECKTELYRGMCSLGNHMLWLEDQLRATAPLSPSVAVKALEWAEGPDGSYMEVSESILGTYRVWEINGMACVSLEGGPGRISGATIPEAKAAAQADYEARIRSALSAQVQDVAGWQSMSTAPRDGTVIQAWHTVHKCPISILWNKDGHDFNGEALHWFERSYTTAWPEHAFSHWMPIPAAPAKQEG